MTVKRLLQHAVNLLNSHNIEGAFIAAEVILRHILKYSRVQLYQQPDSEVLDEQAVVFDKLLQRHLEGEPVAYITGHKEFYGLDFTVDSRVLIPRPETEMLVDKAIRMVKDKGYHNLVDVGTGSGAIAIALATNLTNVNIYALDIAIPALEVAQQNSRKHGVSHRITFLPGNLLEPLYEPVDLIIANLPYVKTADLSEPSIAYEPSLALNGGREGLDVIRKFVPQCKMKLKPGGALLMEIGHGQCDEVVSIIRANLPLISIQIDVDYGGVDRIITGLY